jgi:hypothetical protein
MAPIRKKKVEVAKALGIGCKPFQFRREKGEFSLAGTRLCSITAGVSFGAAVAPSGAAAAGGAVNVWFVGAGS